MDEDKYRGDAEGGEGVGGVGDSPSEAREEAEEGEEVGEGWVGTVVGVFGFCTRVSQGQWWGRGAGLQGEAVRF